MEKHVIYKLTSPKNKVYIGRTNDFDGRMASHKKNAKKGHDYTLYRAIRKYGWNSFTKEIIATVDTQMEAMYKELLFITEYDAVNKGYNSTYNTEGGDIWEGMRDTEKYSEYVKKMKEINGGENNGMYGKTHTTEAKLKQKAKAKGRFSLPWFIEKYGEQEGNDKYQERCAFLSSRKMNRDSEGNFIKATTA